ncbi:MAG: hypothetical protein HPY44_10160 [Armatimonadetes bacterium]|nr:hypothetical protein [Armatimonadota bacterium]
MADTVQINRAPVLALWAAVVCERLGHDEDAALTLGKALAGLNAQSKGRSLGVFGPPRHLDEEGKPKKKGLGEEFWVEVLGRPVPAKNTDAGLRAVVKDEAIDPEKVRTYLQNKFGADLDRVRDAMRALADSLEPEALAEAGYELYERFRPQIASGKKGWGQKGELDLDLIRSLAKLR